MASAAAPRIDDTNSATATAPALARILAGFRRDCCPATHSEDLLVQVMARSFFAALRVTGIETNLIAAQVKAISNHPGIQAYARLHGTGSQYDTRRLGHAFEVDCSGRSAQLKIVRTAATYDQAFIRAQTSLQKLQQMRQSKPNGRAA